MVAMYSWRQLILGVCFVAQFCAVALVSFIVATFANIRHDDIYLDREAFWTRDEIVSNALSYALNGSIAATIVAVIIFFTNHVLLKNMDEINGKKTAMIFALICWLWIMLLALHMSNTYLQHGANLPA